MSLTIGRRGMVLPDGWQYRLVVWVAAATLGTLFGRYLLPDTARTMLFAASVVLFLMWEAAQARWGRWAVVPGVILSVIGLSQDWILVVTFGLVILLLALPGRIALPLVGVGVGLMVWRRAETSSGIALLGTMVGLLSQVLLFYIVERVAAVARQLRESRDELAALEVDAERTRLAEELNTLIGTTLHQVSHQVAEIRAERRDDDAVLTEQLDDITAHVEHGREQLKLLSYEPVVADFHSEVSTAQVLTSRLGVDFVASVELVPAAVDHAFALILRESITNMFKHAIPTRCTVAARIQEGAALLSITNDGDDSDRTHVDDELRSPEPGSGHRRWRTIAEELGGTLRAEHLTRGRFRVVVQVPIDPVATADTPTVAQQEKASHG